MNDNDRDALDDFKKLRIKPLFKPSGTGQSMGIIAYKTGESNENFKWRFYENINKINKELGNGQWQVTLFLSCQF